MNIKQDIAMARKPTELETKYKLGEISTTKKRVDILEEETAIDTELSLSSSNAVANSVITDALNKKVNAITGKTLTTNDFTSAYKTKLEGIEANANYYTEPIGAVFLSVVELDTPNDTWEFIDSITIGTEIIYCYKKIS